MTYLFSDAVSRSIFTLKHLKTNLKNISSHVFFVVILACLFKPRFILIWIGRHQALNRNQDRFQSLRG
jgi:hypothetical protein